MEQALTDPRKPRPLKPRALNVLVADANSFSRTLLGEILRNLGVVNIASARNADLAMTATVERQVDVVLACWDPGDALDALGFVRTLRASDDPRTRRLPVVYITGGLTRQSVISGRDAGVDEFLNKPISPAALRQRLEMVVETPRPFIDSPIFLGPCRRRKNPADYYGARRRAGERGVRAPLVDQDEIARETPMRLALSELRNACASLPTSRPEAFAPALDSLRAAKDLAVQQDDHAVHAALASFESYLGVAAPLGHVDQDAVTSALAALEQLAALPPTFADARDSVAAALGKAIQKKLAA